VNCSNCEREFDDNSGWGLENWSTVNVPFQFQFCDISCLIEFAWKLKESQPKLSKSRIACETDPTISTAK
jgi:hypothetical protein